MGSAAKENILETQPKLLQERTPKQLSTNPPRSHRPPIEGRDEGARPAWTVLSHSQKRRRLRCATEGLFWEIDSPGVVTSSSKFKGSLKINKICMKRKTVTGSL